MVHMLWCAHVHVHKPAGTASRRQDTGAHPQRPTLEGRSACALLATATPRPCSVMRAPEVAHVADPVLNHDRQVPRHAQDDSACRSMQSSHRVSFTQHEQRT